MLLFSFILLLRQTVVKLLSDWDELELKHFAVKCLKKSYCSSSWGLDGRLCSSNILTFSFRMDLLLFQWPALFVDNQTPLFFYLLSSRMVSSILRDHSVEFALLCLLESELIFTPTLALDFLIEHKLAACLAIFVWVTTCTVVCNPYLLSHPSLKERNFPWILMCSAQVYKGGKERAPALLCYYQESSQNLLNDRTQSYYFVQ